MRLKMNFKFLVDNPMIDFNYRHRVQGMLYDILERKNSKLGQRLHDSDTISEFVFSQLEFRDIRIKNNKICPTNKNFCLYISSINKEIIDCIKQSKGDILQLGNDIFIRVESIEEEVIDNDLKNRMFYSDLILQRQNSKGEKISYLFEKDDFKNIEKSFFNNLIRKYNFVTKTKTTFDISSMKLNIIQSKKKCEIYKGGKLIYYNCLLSMECPNELLKIAYFMGIGNKNQSGFGYLKKY